MTKYVALLRAVNLAGTNRIAMSDLKCMCESAGFSKPRTYIASGNVVFESNLSESSVKGRLERCVAVHAGKPVEVLVRTGREMAAVLAGNPFKSGAPNRTVAIFLDEPPAKDTLKTVTGQRTEQIALGTREIYVHYRNGIGNSKLKIPAGRRGTARNMNTIAKLTEWTAK
jgi:uncharacterized protein (DUF1697 family)